jgi:transposase-like protein
MPPRKFPPEFKKRVVLEFEAGEKKSAQLCRDFQISDSLLRRWVVQYREHGDRAWRREDPKAQELLEAEKRIAELESALGRATLEVDFLKRCLKRANVPLP